MSIASPNMSIASPSMSKSEIAGTGSLKGVKTRVCISLQSFSNQF